MSKYFVLVRGQGRWRENFRASHGGDLWIWRSSHGIHAFYRQPPRGRILQRKLIQLTGGQKLQSLPFPVHNIFSACWLCGFFKFRCIVSDVTVNNLDSKKENFLDLFFFESSQKAKQIGALIRGSKEGHEPWLIIVRGSFTIKHIQPTEFEKPLFSTSCRSSSCMWFSDSVKVLQRSSL